MQLAAVMDRIGDALEAIPGLRVFPYYIESVSPPAAIVGWPDEFEFDSTMARGADRCVIPVVVLVGRADARSARDQLAVYIDGSGGTSVKQAVEQYIGAPGVWDSARVQSVEFGGVSIASVPYLAATFNIEVIGRGA